jgi:hypothetical protein
LTAFSADPYVVLPAASQKLYSLKNFPNWQVRTVTVVERSFCLLIMPLTVESDKESPVGVAISRPRRPITLSSRLTDANNDATQELSIHRSAPTANALEVQKSAQVNNKRGADDAISLSSASDDGIDKARAARPLKGMYFASPSDRAFSIYYKPP